jgi:hypothetical protein
MSGQESIERRGIVPGRTKVRYLSGLGLPDLQGVVFDVFFPLSTKGKLNVGESWRTTFKDWHNLFEIVEA